MIHLTIIDPQATDIEEVVYSKPTPTKQNALLSISDIIKYRPADTLPLSLESFFKTQNINVLAYIPLMGKNFNPQTIAKDNPHELVALLKLPDRPTIFIPEPIVLVECEVDQEFTSFKHGVDISQSFKPYVTVYTKGEAQAQINKAEEANNIMDLIQNLINEN